MGSPSFFDSTDFGEQPKGPLAWLPWTVDNSSGAPFWAITDKWGLLSQQLLFTSYGRCALFATLRHKVGDLDQAAMVPMGLSFDTGRLCSGQAASGYSDWRLPNPKQQGYRSATATGSPWPDCA